MKLKDEIKRMIPVRGLSIIDRKLKDFVTIDSPKPKRVPSAIRNAERNASKKPGFRSPYDAKAQKLKIETNIERKRTRTKTKAPLAITHRSSFRRKRDELTSSDSEGTRELYKAFEENPQAFIKVDSKYYDKLPAIDRARVYILEKKPKKTDATGLGIDYTNPYAMKNYLKQTLSRMDLSPEKLTALDAPLEQVPSQVEDTRSSMPDSIQGAAAAQ